MINLGSNLKNGIFFTLTDIWSDILLSTPNKKHDIYRAFLRFRGGPCRTRTDTVSLPVDFESTLSTNFNKGPRKLLYQKSGLLKKEIFSSN